MGICSVLLWTKYWNFRSYKTLGFPYQVGSCCFLIMDSVSCGYLLTPWSGILLEKLTSSQLVKKFPVFYGTWRSFTTVTSARHLSLSWASLIQSMPPHRTLWRSILIVSSHLCLGLPSGFFPSGFPTNILYTPLLSPIRATFPAHLILLSLITLTILGEEYRSLSSSLCSLLHSPITLSLLGPNVLLSTLSTWIARWKRKGKVHSRIWHEGPGGNRCRALLFL